MGQKGKQSKLKVTNKMMLEQFPEHLDIEQDVDAGDVIVAAIGDEYETNGSTYVPITIAQARNDVSTASTNDEGMFFRGWTGFTRIVRKTLTATPSMLKANNLSVGSVIKNCNLYLDRGFAPYFPGHQPMVYGQNSPREGEAIVSDGKAVYENVRFKQGNGEHTGLDIAFDTVTSDVVEEVLAI